MDLVADQFYMIASQFQNTGTGASVDIQEFIQSSDMIGGDYDDDTAPNLKLWDGAGYVDYYFWEEDWFGNQKVWCDSGMAVEDVPVDLGNGAFLKVKNNCSITIAGQVAEADALNVPLTAGSFNLIANPFPVAFDINGENVNFSEVLTGGDYDDEGAPNLKIWDGVGYSDYYFWEEDWFGNQKVWCDSGMAVEDVVVDPGHGFWLKYTSGSDVELTFSK